MEKDIEYLTAKICVGLGVNPAYLASAEKTLTERVREVCVERGIDVGRVHVTLRRVELLQEALQKRKAEERDEST